MDKNRKLNLLKIIIDYLQNSVNECDFLPNKDAKNKWLKELLNEIDEDQKGIEEIAEKINLALYINEALLLPEDKKLIINIINELNKSDETEPK